MNGVTELPDSCQKFAPPVDSLFAIERLRQWRLFWFFKFVKVALPWTILRVTAVTVGVIAESILGAQPLGATPFTSTIPGTTDPIPPNFPEAGGFVVILIGANGNYYFQYVEPSQMYVGFANSGTPVAFQGNPTQIAPTFNIDCGAQGCSTYFGGSIATMHFRFSVLDGDTRAGEFDENDMDLRINGFSIGNWTPIAVETTTADGLTGLGTGVGFGNDLFDTGWFTTTNTALLSNVFTTLQVTTTMFDNDPDDNFWDFTTGPAGTAPTQIAPGWTIDKRALNGSYSSVGENLSYEFDIFNVGTIQLSSINVSDDKIASVNCPSTTLAPSASMTCTGGHTITQADIDAGGITNIATATGTPNFGTLATITDTATVPANVVATMAMTKTADDDTLRAVGDTIIYTYTLTNTGNVTIENVTINDTHNASGPAPIPTAEALSNDVAPLNDSTDATNDNSWDSLAPGDSITFSSTYTVTQTDVDTLQ